MDNETWVKLLRGLRSATLHAALRWAEKERRYEDSGKKFNRPPSLRGRIYSARQKSAMYEIVSADPAGRGPYEFAFWRIVDNRLETAGAVSSSARLIDHQSLELNNELERLFTAVDSTTESGDALVSRLLRELQEDG
ncbi:hypothetical protein [Rathayibacter sp. AY1C1]|uniref:hypothetical protein n=1 Tax=Rathayibacter sp. AY1C1 TaxID=2080534 RepID=UPI0011B016DC|nr:hypothetical protein [Rathayibacter sp. AY1C1]